MRADLAAAQNFDRVDHRRVQRKHALDAFAVGNLPHGEILVQAGAGAADANAFIGLHARPFALDDLDVNDERVARTEIGDVLAGAELRHLLGFNFLDQVHGNSPTAAYRLRCGRGLEPELSGLRELLRYRVGFVTLP
jgi:hypothetical protein